MAKSFADATAVKQLSSHSYMPHGGFVTAAFLRVVEVHFKTTLSSQCQPHSIALHLEFLRRTQVGPATFTVRDSKLGRQTSVVHVTLTQGTPPNAREEVVGYITNADMDSENGVSFPTGYQLIPRPLPVDISLLNQDKDKRWARQGNMPFSSFRKATMKTQFHFPRDGQATKSTADEWIRFANGERWTNTTLGYVCDMWPMPVEALVNAENPYNIKRNQGGERKRTNWYPTVSIGLDIKKSLPKEGVEWLFVRVATKQIKNGRMDLEIVILDEEGGLVAISNHVALVVGAERNLAERRVDAKI